MNKPRSRQHPCLLAGGLVALLMCGWQQESLAATAGGAGCARPAATGMITANIVSGSRVRPVKLFLPSGHDGTRPVALVLDLHGSNGSGADQAWNSNFASVAQRHGFVVAWPDGGVTLPDSPDRHYWNIVGLPLTGNRPMPADAPDDVQFISDTIDQLAAGFCIDRARVYATGHSGGGRMSSLLACRLADRIAAVAPVVGLRAGLPSRTDPRRPDPASCAPARPVPVITFHGTDDLTNPYEGGGNDYWQYGVDAALGRWVELNGCNATPNSEKIAAHVERVRFGRCRDNVAVELIRIDASGEQGGGHTWPGSPRRRDPAPGAAPNYPSREISASERIWEFFSRYRL